MHPVFRTQSEKDISERGRSRAPRDLEENSFESYDSFDSASDDIDIDTDDDGGGGDDDSYEPADSSAIKLDSTTEMEYESDDGSAAYSAASETDNAPVSTSEYSEDDDEYEEDEDVALITVNNNNSASEFLSSASESTDNDSPVDEDDFEDEMSDEYVPDDSFVTNNQDSDEYGSEEEDDNPSESDYGSEEEDQFDENDTGGHAVVSRRLADKADDDLFWKRYGYSQRVGNFEDEASNEYTPSGSSSGGDSDDDDDDDDGKGGDFDDGDTFKDELVAQAFPSLAVSDDEDSKKDTKRKLTGGTAELMARARGWFDCSSCLESEILKGKYKWYIIGGCIFFVLLVVVGISMKFVLPSNKDNTEDDQQQQSTVPAVTTAPTTAPLAATLSPTLPEGQVGQPITFLAYVVDGKENNVTVESLEDELSGAFDVLAPQVLTNLTVAEADNNNSSNNNNNTSGRLRGRGLLREPLQGHSRGGLRGRHLRRELVATGVKLPVPVDVVERGKQTLSLIRFFFFFCLPRRILLTPTTNNPKKSSLPRWRTGPRQKPVRDSSSRHCLVHGRRHRRLRLRHGDARRNRGRWIAGRGRCHRIQHDDRDARCGHRNRVAIGVPCTHGVPRTNLVRESYRVVLRHREELRRLGGKRPVQHQSRLHGLLLRQGVRCVRNRVSHHPATVLPAHHGSNRTIGRRRWDNRTRCLRGRKHRLFRAWRRRELSRDEVCFLGERR